MRERNLTEVSQMMFFPIVFGLWYLYRYEDCAKARRWENATWQLPEDHLDNTLIKDKVLEKYEIRNIENENMLPEDRLDIYVDSMKFQKFSVCNKEIVFNLV